MVSIFFLAALLLAYLFGSIPTAVWLGQSFYGVDVREYGSGNAGATNTFRVLGVKAGIGVMSIDILKGWTATNLRSEEHTSELQSLMRISYAVFCLKKKNKNKEETIKKIK